MGKSGPPGTPIVASRKLIDVKSKIVVFHQLFTTVLALRLSSYMDVLRCLMILHVRCLDMRFRKLHYALRKLFVSSS